ncbi:50S ribosomal protein L25/general stress protein Ctc [Pseudalkalibacillus salsuginis]|uniref:50S ribosomal protein L25/general stress protein Ctc n=1 Tax=Pseudalkalibacillus salsuginis TaxID=2910972 RepID=UPI001F23131B|nr:50S ribosomal protein L25/general stress protein Ctc [Pseudalkalibacillus salsuginis]MCF6411921.1 50S ribosomal protein L25/general stress protein Ctc [Pseudalkalibacillus salsuginis]
MAIDLDATVRDDFTRSNTRKLREEGHVPAVFYGKGDSKPIYLDRINFIKSIREGGINTVINLKIGKDKHSAMVQDIQMDHLKDLILHIDFREINLNKETDADVPVHLTGEAAGVKEGGVVQHFLHEITVRALPAEIPSEIEVNIGELNISDSFTVADLKENSSYQIMTDPEEVVVSIAPPTEEPEEEVEDEEDQEPELVGEKGASEGDDNEEAPK